MQVASHTRCFSVALAIALLTGTFVLLDSAPARAQSENLLSGKTIESSNGVSRVQQLADGFAPEEGAFWLTDVTSRLGSPAAQVTWDLGKAESIRCAQLQGDNNDMYFVSGSLDGINFFPIWTAGPADGAGMRYRHGKIVANARWIRTTASGGDGMYAIGDMALFTTCPTAMPVEPQRIDGEPVAESAFTSLLVFAAVLLVVILLSNNRNLKVTLLFALVPLFLLVGLFNQLSELYPLFNSYGIASLQNEQTFEAAMRALVAALAGVVIYKETFARLKIHPRVRNVILGFLAIASIGCYYHFGAAQFFNHGNGQRTHVHTFDQRHYIPMAKYFDELKFDGLYAASAAAYVDLAGKKIEDIGQVEFRDLRSSQMRKAIDMKDHIEEVKRRFSDERWLSFKNDMRNFVEIMGPGDYLGGMSDHGGNATPVWLIGAYALLHDAQFTERNLVLVGLIDPVLVLLLLIVVWRTFDFRMAAYVAILFGATDFYMFGTNLMGSILRQDWLVALGIGACALKRNRPMLGGALLAYGGLIRAFPAVSTMFLLVPILWQIIDHLRAEKKLPTLRALMKSQQTAIRAIAGAALCVTLFFAATSITYGASNSWGNWAKKIAIHASDPSVNNVGLRNVMAFKPSTTGKSLRDRNVPDVWGEWMRHFDETLSQRRVLFIAAMFGFVALAFLASRKRKVEQTALLGLLIIPFVFYPSNYYLHYIFLLPIAIAATTPSDAENKRFANGMIALMAICVAQFFTLAEGWTDLRFTYQSFIALGAFVMLVLPPAIDTIKELLPPPVEKDAAKAEGQG
jgi:hypothetical protein